jgi:hypothetical protein
MTLQIPASVTLLDGTSAQVKAVAAEVVEGRLARVVYTLEKPSRAWIEVGSEAIRTTQ